MIPIENPSWAASQGLQPLSTRLRTSRGGLMSPTMFKKMLRGLALLMAVTILAGCTNSKLIIGPLYNRLDDQMRNEFNKMGTFTDAQTQAFEQAVGTFHVWHRQNEMPKYADLLGEIAQSIGQQGATSKADVDSWAASLEVLSKNVRECHPVNYSIDLIQSLSDKQIDAIERRFKAERLKNREKYGSQTKEERVERRLKNMVKWSGRLGLDFTTAQKAILRDSLTQQVSLRKEYYALSEEWNNYLFFLARNQENPAYDAALQKHISRLWTLLEKAHPEEWHAIRDLWRETTYTLIGTFSRDQRTVTRQWLSKMAKTVKGISRDKPSFKVNPDAGDGCLVAATN